MNAPASTQRPTPGRTPGGRERAAKRARGPRRGTAAAVEDRPLRLLPGRTRPMSEDERTRLVGALAELLADWLQAHQERLPSSLRSPANPDLMDPSPRAQEPMP